MKIVITTMLLFICHFSCNSSNRVGKLENLRNYSLEDSTIYLIYSYKSSPFKVRIDRLKFNLDTVFVTALKKNIDANINLYRFQIPTLESYFELTDKENPEYLISNKYLYSNSEILDLNNLCLLVDLKLNKMNEEQDNAELLLINKNEQLNLFHFKY
ncbi:MAG: hypothetical protein JNM67_09850, partial [Bacteroidetes bacterium]|nr:hypothetical protein [Bacteroidota bacterium]